MLEKPDCLPSGVSLCSQRITLDGKNLMTIALLILIDHLTIESPCPRTAPTKTPNFLGGVGVQQEIFPGPVAQAQ